MKTMNDFLKEGMAKAVEISRRYIDSRKDLLTFDPRPCTMEDLKAPNFVQKMNIDEKEE